MLVVRIELWSARTGKKTELGAMVISNTGGTAARGDYEVRVARTFERLRKGKLWRTGEVKDFPRRSLLAWDLLLRALLSTVGDRNRNAVNALYRPARVAQGEDGTGAGGRPGNVSRSV